MVKSGKNNSAQKRNRLIYKIGKVVGEGSDRSFSMWTFEAMIKKFQNQDLRLEDKTMPSVTVEDRGQILH